MRDQIVLKIDVGNLVLVRDLDVAEVLEEGVRRGTVCTILAQIVDIGAHRLKNQKITWHPDVRHELRGVRS